MKQPDDPEQRPDESSEGSSLEEEAKEESPRPEDAGAPDEGAAERRDSGDDAREVEEASPAAEAPEDDEDDAVQDDAADDREEHPEDGEDDAVQDDAADDREEHPEDDEDEEAVAGDDSPEKPGLEKAPPLTLGLDHLKRVLESLIFVADKPIGERQLAKAARSRPSEIRPLLHDLMREYSERGIELVEVAGGYQFRSAKKNAAFVRDFVAPKPVRMSRAQLETLAIVAYRQPVTRPEVDEIRGVDSGNALKMLAERDLLKILGRKDEPGRPLLYGTTAHFLEFFGLSSLKDLPTLKEFSELSEESRALFERKIGEPIDFKSLEAQAKAAEEAMQKEELQRELDYDDEEESEAADHGEASAAHSEVGPSADSAASDTTAPIEESEPLEVGGAKDTPGPLSEGPNVEEASDDSDAEPPEEGGEEETWDDALDHPEAREELSDDFADEDFEHEDEEEDGFENEDFEDEGFEDDEVDDQENEDR